MVSEFTQEQRLLLVALKLEESGRSPFLSETLQVEAWRGYPFTFGLKGHEDKHPDSIRIYETLLTLLKQDLLKYSKRELHYGLTVAGRQEAYETETEYGTPIEEPEEVGEPLPIEARRPRRPSWELDGEAWLSLVLNSRAFDLHQTGRGREIDFAEACRFYGFERETPPEEIKSHLKGFRLAVSNLRDAVEDAERGNLILASGRVISRRVISMIEEAEDCVAKRFAKLIKILIQKEGK